MAGFSDYVKKKEEKRRRKLMGEYSEEANLHEENLSCVLLC